MWQCLLINRNDALFCRTKTDKICLRIWNVSNKYGKQLLDTATNTRLNASKKVIHKTAKATGEFIRNKIADAIAKSCNDKIVKTKPIIHGNLRNVEEILNDLG